MCRFLVHVKSVLNLSRRLLQKYQYISNQAINTPFNAPVNVFLSLFISSISLFDRLFLYVLKMLHDDICLPTRLFNPKVPPLIITSLPIRVIRLIHTVLFVHLFYTIVLNLA